MNDEQLERAALTAPDEIDYARMGWYTLQTAGKVPLTGSHGWRDATIDETTIRARWAANPEAGVAVATWPSKLVVVDIDPRNGGEETAARVLTGELPPHPRSRTRSGGSHLVFRAPVCSEIATQKNGLGPGIDVIASGHGYFVVDPSPGYSWIVSPRDVQPPHLPIGLWRALPKVTARPRKPRRIAKRALRFRLDDVLPRLQRLRGSDKRGWLALCPAHTDHAPSFSIREGDDGQPLFHCFGGCSFEQIVPALERLAGVKGAA